MNYLAYCRKSTDEPDRQIISIQAQITEVKQFALKENLNIVDIIIESKTAKVPGRNGFNRLIKLIEQGSADGIIAWHPDRLARNSVDGGQLIYLLDTGKLLDLKFPTFWFDNTPQGKFMLNIAFGQSKYYVDNLAENVKRGLRQKIRNGIWPNKAPLGYLNNHQTKTIVVDPKTSRYIVKSFRLFATGAFTFVDIRDFLFDHQVFSSKISQSIHLDTIKRILTNPFYCGLMLWQGELFVGKHQALISQKFFDQVQEVIKTKCQPYQDNKSDFPFLKLAKCGECGSAITAEKHRKFYQRRQVTVDYYYYRCSKKKGPCHQSYLPASIFDQQLRDIIYSVSSSPFAAKKFLEWGRIDAQKDKLKYQSQLDHLTSAISGINSKLDRLLDGYLDQAITKVEYQTKKNQLIKSKAVLQSQVKDIKAKGTAWLEPFQEFVNGALSAQKIAQTKNNGDDLLIIAQTVGSNFFLLNKKLTPKFKNAAYDALAADGLAARATQKNPFSEILLPGMDSNHDLSVQSRCAYH